MKYIIKSEFYIIKKVFLLRKLKLFSIPLIIFKCVFIYNLYILLKKGGLDDCCVVLLRKKKLFVDKITSRPVCRDRERSFAATRIEFSVDFSPIPLKGNKNDAKNRLKRGFSLKRSAVKIIKERGR